MMFAPAFRFAKFFLFKFLGLEKLMRCRCIAIFTILVFDLDKLSGLICLNTLSSNFFILTVEESSQ
jgi:hypothetical protein